jgi:alpha-beta hydrolase superfamily lysophospholipase
MAERITVKTIDEVTIVGDWVTAPTTVGAVILLHSMPLNRKSWLGFQTTLAKIGLASLAIDLRGHGESLQGPEGASIDFRNFSDEEHETSLYDVIAAYDWVGRRGIDPERITLAGASVGANLAIRMLAEEPRIRGAVLLSPGRSYQGMNAVFDVESILPHQALWMAASEGDDQEAFESTKEVYDKAPSELKTFEPLKNAGHGTNIFTARPDLMDAASAFLKNVAQHV